MVLCNDQQCCVCFESYSRNVHIPRVLFCHHTFCDPCLQSMTKYKKDKLTVQCPLCRQITVINPNYTLQDVLRVDSKLWDCIAEEQNVEEDERRTSPEEREAIPAQIQGSRPSPNHDRLKLRIPGFVKKMMVPRQLEERNIPRSNVQMKSWRRLRGEEIA